MRLIDAQPIEERLKRSAQTYEELHCYSLLSVATLDLERIKDAPTVDAEPVRHGRWIEEESDEVGDIFRCSECGHIIAEDFALMEEIQERGDRLYCDHCGAKMEAEG